MPRRLRVEYAGAVYHVMAAIGLTEAEVQARKSTDLEKLSLAWLLKKHTKVTGTWVAERLSMGHRVNAFRAISRFDRGAGQNQGAEGENVTMYGLTPR